MGIQGIIHGKSYGTTVEDKKATCPLDKVNRKFRVPAANILWISDFTCVGNLEGVRLCCARDRSLCPQDRGLAVSMRRGPSGADVI